VKIGDIFKTLSGGTPSKSKAEYYDGGTIPWLGSGELAQGEITTAKNYITEIALKESSAKVFPKDSLLVAMYGATVGQVGILRFESSTNQAVCAILPNPEKALPEYLYVVFLGSKSKLVALSAGGAQPNISQQIIKDFKIPLPSLEVQNQIANEFAEEQEIVESNKKLISIYEQKIQQTLSAIWVA
jgi:restriction endonuclease S subunit